MSTQEVKKSAFIKKDQLQTIVPYIGLSFIVVLFFILTKGKIFKINNIKLILDQSIVLLLSSIGVFCVMTIGGLDFSQGSILGISSIVVAYLSHYGMLAAAAAGIGSGIVIGLLNGVLNVKFRIMSFIATICTMFIFRGVCAFLTTEKPIMGSGLLIEYDYLYFKLPILLIILISAFLLVKYSKFFRECKAVGAGETAAGFAGVNVDKIKIFVFMIAGGMAGMAAFFNVIKVGSITATAGSLLETNVLIALVLGGMPVSGGARVRFSSIIIGCLIFSVLGNGLVLLQVLPNIQQIIRSGIFLLVVALTMNRKAAAVIK